MFMRTLVAAAVTCLSVVGLSHAVDAPAAIKKSISIPAQALGSALEALSTQRDVHVVYFSEDVRNRRSEQVSGEFTVDEALHQLLSGSGLTFQYLDERTITIVPMAAAPAASRTHNASPVALRLAQSAPAEAGDAAEKATEGDGLEEILVRGRQQKLSTMKGDAPVLEIPQNIQILSGALLEDMGAVLLEDGLRNVAGVMPGGYNNGWDYYRIRGFTSDATYLDGLRLDNFTGLNVELSTLERVEVIKGPASTLYGDLFSGMVNLVSKRPKAEGFFDVGLTAGSYGFQEATLDFGGSLNGGKTVYGRMIAVYRHDDTYIDLSKGMTRYYVAPSLTWEIGPASTLTLLATANRDVNDLAGTLPAYGTVLPNPNGKLPFDRYTGDALDPEARIDESRTLGYQFTHEINSSLSFRQNARAAWRSCDTRQPKLFSWYLDGDQRTLYRFASSGTCDWDIYTVDSGLDASFAMGRTQHHMTVGVDYTRTAYVSRQSWSDFGDPTAIPPLDLYDPVYLPVGDVQMIPAAPYDASTRSVGFYLNDRIKLTESLSLTAGGRFERSEGGDNYAPHESGSVFVPNVGISYELVAGLVAYANYSESFSPQYYIRLPGNRFPDPLRGKSEEIGLKTALFDDRLNSTFAVFNLERENVAMSDPTNPGFYVLSGDERSRGFEVDSQILITPAWEMLASLTYIDGEVTSSENVPVGSPLINAPKRAASLWTKYTIRDGALRGVAFSVGGSTYSDQSGDAAHTFDLPAYTLVNANVTYRKDNFRAQVNFNNLLDEEYYAGSYDANYILPGRPRTVFLNLGWSY
jgi:iron complex outermembrane receptor protein